jgi:beta-mannosidase
MVQQIFLDSGWRLLDSNPNEWEWSNRARRQHDLSGWRAVTVPASVQAALLETGEIKHPYHDLNSREAEWIEHRDWVYGLDFDAPARSAGGRVFLEFASVDDACLVYLNGALLAKHEGPGAPFSVEIGPALRESANQLIIVVKAPQPEFPQIGWTEQTRSLKGRMGFGWDFAPRLVRVGLVGRVSLRLTGPTCLSDLWVRSALSPDYRQATLTLEALSDGPAGQPVRFSLWRENRPVAETVVTPDATGLARASLELSEPELWWPNGLGNQPLYVARAEALDASDRLETNIGLRRLEWGRSPGAAPTEWPFTLRVNGQPAFQKGWNWVPADQMGGPAADERAVNLLQRACQAGVNFLRCWGGADPETPAFYDQCDRLGLLVWQEFPMSSAGINNTPPTGPAYLARLEAYAGPVVRTRRNHPSLALWGGGNELTEEDNRPLTQGHPYARCLQAVVAQFDPERQFRPSSPLGPEFDADPEKGELWDVHGAWEYSERWPGPQYWRFNAINPLLHSEMGLPGEASLATQQCFLPAQPPLRRNPARRHHGGDWWDHQAVIENLFGPLEDDDQFILASQWLQAEGLRYAVEASRRRWPHTAGVFPWQLNEPWPLAVCTSAVEYTGQPKLAYYAVKQAYRARLATARYAGLKLAEAGLLQAELWFLNDLAAVNGEIKVGLHTLNGQPLANTRVFEYNAPANSSLRVSGLEMPLPPGFEGTMVMSVAWPEGSNRYIFSNLAGPPLRELPAYPELLNGLFEAEV